MIQNNKDNKRTLFFRKQLLEWYKENGRTLPWRQTKDPYKIWVSEIILQQTQVTQGYDYYLRFIDSLPNIESLALVSEEKLLLLWQGLGYYSRAHNMKVAAQQIMAQYSGVFPRTQESVRRLKGIGPYTTAAIMSIAYDYPLAVVDGNVYRVLSRFDGIETPIDTTVGKKFFSALAQKYLAPEFPSEYNQAIMDFGALICTPQKPKCENCPLENMCISRGCDLRFLLPIKSKKNKVSEQYLSFNFLLHNDGSFAVEQRDKKGIWKGLFQFPLQLSEKIFPPPPILNGWTLKKEIHLVDHRLTHRLLHIKVNLFTPKREGAIKETTYRWIELDKHTEIALPRPLRTFINQFHPLR